MYGIVVRCANRHCLKQVYISMKFLTLQDQYVTLSKVFVCIITQFLYRELRVNTTILTGEGTNTLALDQVAKTASSVCYKNIAR